MKKMSLDCKFRNLCEGCDINQANKCCLNLKIKNGNFYLCRRYKVCPNLTACKMAVDGTLSRTSLFNRIIPSAEDFGKINFSIKKPYEKFSETFIPRIEVNNKNYEEQIDVLTDTLSSLVISFLQQEAA